MRESGGLDGRWDIEGYPPPRTGRSTADERLSQRRSHLPGLWCVEMIVLNNRGCSDMCKLSMHLLHELEVCPFFRLASKFQLRHPVDGKFHCGAGPKKNPRSGSRRQRYDALLLAKSVPPAPAIKSATPRQPTGGMPTAHVDRSTADVKFSERKG